MPQQCTGTQQQLISQPLTRAESKVTFIRNTGCMTSVIDSCVGGKLPTHVDLTD